MAAQKTITIEAATWCDEIEQILLPACTAIDQVRLQVEAGRAVLYCGICEGKIIGAFVLRVAVLASGAHEGVIVAAAGRGGDVNLIDALYPTIESMFIDCESVRVHTIRRGMAKRLLERGYEFQEIVMKKDLSK